MLKSHLVPYKDSYPDHAACRLHVPAHSLKLEPALNLPYAELKEATATPEEKAAVISSRANSLVCALAARRSRRGNRAAEEAGVSVRKLEGRLQPQLRPT